MIVTKIPEEWTKTRKLPFLDAEESVKIKNYRQIISSQKVTILTILTKVC
jgi:hypothetical protein